MDEEKRSLDRELVRALNDQACDLVWRLSRECIRLAAKYNMDITEDDQRRIDEMRGRINSICELRDMIQLTLEDDQGEGDYE